MTSHALPRPAVEETSYPARLLLSVTACWVVLIAACETLGLDRRIVAHLASENGFEWREAWWLRTLLHDDLKLVSQAAFATLALATWKPFGFLRNTPALERISMLVGVTASLAIVSVIKYFSLTSCPWDLVQFGGVAQYISHWSWGLGDGGPGRCFPSGHASAGFAFLPLALPALLSGLPERRRLGLRLLLAVLLFGLACGGAQVLRGAHYPSHVLWSGFICWVVAVLNYSITRLALHPEAALTYTR